MEGRLARGNRPGNLKITGQFSLAFVGLLLLLGGVAATGWISLSFVRRETEAAIVTSIKIQRLVFEMKEKLDQARRKEREFFQEWSANSFLQAYDEYAREHREKIGEVLHLSGELQDVLSSADTSVALRQSNPYLLAYVDAVREYADSFRETMQLVGDLGMDGTGAIARMKQNSNRLQDMLSLADRPELMAGHSQVLAAEGEYRLQPDGLSLEKLLEAIEALRQGIVNSTDLDEEQQKKALGYLRNYELLADNIVNLDAKIGSQIEGFEEQVASFSHKLIELANDEVQEARARIDATSQWATILLMSALVLALALAAAIANRFLWALSQLAAEQEKSERLLLNILPKVIADRLKQNEKTIADSFPEVTVLFADIAGFTQLSARVSPQELVQLLNEIFCGFDLLVEQHSLEKIKTIGDAYMVVGGLPMPRSDHAEAIADMALDMQGEVDRFNAKHDASLSIRIGINTGPVVAGVIGTKKFIYDLWGDAVNTASRMESHGIPGYIQLTSSTYELLRDRYLVEERGTIEVKGKGEMNTYLLKGKKVPLLAIGDR